MLNVRNLLIAGACALCIPPDIANSEIVGAVTALQTNISNNRGKSLAVGNKISLGDQLTSNSTGLGMIVFDDESSAKIGPNSTLTIDEFVYQRGRNRGAIAVNMNFGLVRFYGGRISKSGRMEITTPHVVLGVRGGILDTLVKDGLTKAILRSGRMFCSVNGTKKIVTKPGFSCLSDGSSLKLVKATGDEMRILDSQDKEAGSGRPGNAASLIARAPCISATHHNAVRCNSKSGKLPGISILSHLRHRYPPIGYDQHNYESEYQVKRSLCTPLVNRFFKHL